MQKTRKIRLQSLTVSGNRGQKHKLFLYDFQNLAENGVIYGENDTKYLIFNYSTRIGMCRNFYDRRDFWLKKFGYDRGVSGGL